jgi:hypothetical protein
MYFEPSKKVYYRFPSNKSILMMDHRMYFPEKPAHATEDLYSHHRSTDYMPEVKHINDFK